MSAPDTAFTMLPFADPNPLGILHCQLGIQDAAVTGSYRTPNTMDPHPSLANQGLDSPGRQLLTGRESQAPR